VKLSSVDLTHLAGLAIGAATEAGEMIARSQPGEVRYKADGSSPASQVVTEVDRRSEAMIVDILGPTLTQYDLGLLTEEQADDGSRLRADHFWCVDPLDGTLAFIEGLPGFAVSIALVERNGTPRIGVVHDPVDQTLLHAISGVGAFRDRDPWPNDPPTGKVLSVFADRSFVSGSDHDTTMESLRKVAVDMGLTGVQLHATRGGVMNACGVLANPPACYIKYPGPSGGGSVWDFAATACLFHEAGAVATDIEGGALDLNREESTFMNHRGVLFATDQVLASRIRTLWEAVQG